jgi:hypothetical protein
MVFCVVCWLFVKKLKGVIVDKCESRWTSLMTPQEETRARSEGGGNRGTCSLLFSLAQAGKYLSSYKYPSFESKLRRSEGFNVFELKGRGGRAGILYHLGQFISP